MPELPEVEVLVRHLRPLLRNRMIHAVQISRDRVLAGTDPRQLKKALRGSKFIGLSRRGKYLLFQLHRPGRSAPLLLIGHLGMTGRMYLAPTRQPLPKHAAVVLNLGAQNFIFEDTRYFGRFTLDHRFIQALGPEPLSADFSAKQFGRALKRSLQPIKVKLLDQALVAGIGNIYASEALFRAGISPQTPARALLMPQVRKLWRSLREVLAEAIDFGSTVPLSYSGTARQDGLFFFGSSGGASRFYEERLRVYDRANLPCLTCRRRIKRILQAGRSTFYCPHCQRAKLQKPARETV
jgi:formamidopyrimidine-DNA glycosylase